MIIKAVWKDPDALGIGIEVWEEDNKTKLSEEERDAVFDMMYKELKLGEYIVLEINTEKKTVTFKEAY